MWPGGPPNGTGPNPGTEHTETILERQLYAENYIPIGCC